MSTLDSCKSRILQAIVDDYVMTAEPVGSERLVASYSFGCKSATVRNEMAEMLEWGYLLQPHTSAGRIPSDQGYRYYVNELMDAPSALSLEEAERARERCRQTQSDVEAIILRACSILSGLTSYPSVATEPAGEVVTVRRIYLSEAGPRHALLVVLLSSGHVEHPLVEMDAVPDERALMMMSNYFNILFADKDAQEIGRAASPAVPMELSALSGSLARIFAALKKTVRAVSEKRVFLEGTSHILRQPEFQNVRRLEALLNALEQRGALYQALRRALPDDVTIIIGAENEHALMQECSIVTRTYTIESRPAGCIGVVGPTRMDYARAAAAVTLMARSLSQMLTHLCPA